MGQDNWNRKKTKPRGYFFGAELCCRNLRAWAVWTPPDVTLSPLFITQSSYSRGPLKAFAQSCNLLLSQSLLGKQQIPMDSGYSCCIAHLWACTLLRTLWGGDAAWLSYLRAGGLDCVMELWKWALHRGLLDSQLLNCWRLQTLRMARVLLSHSGAKKRPTSCLLTWGCLHASHTCLPSACLLCSCELAGDWNLQESCRVLKGFPKLRRCFSQILLDS